MKPPGKLIETIEKLARELETFYGERYEGLVLYGSYARGDADEGSDVDLLLLLEGEVDVVREIRRSEDVKWPLALEADYTISLLPASVETYRESLEPLMRNVRREGQLVS